MTRKCIVRLAFVRLLLGQLPASRQLLLEHREILDQLDDVALRGLYHCRLGYTASLMGDHDLAVRHAGAAVEDAERAGDRVTQGIGHSVLSLEGLWTAPATAGIPEARRSIALLEGTAESIWLGMTWWYLGMSQAITGDLEDALVSAARARALGVGAEDRRIVAFADFGASWVHFLRGEGDLAVELAKRAVGGAPDAIARAIAQGFAGAACSRTGLLAEAIGLLEEARMLARFRHQVCGLFLGFLVDAYTRLGDLDRARAAAADALAEAARSRSAWVIGWIMYLTASLHRAAGALPEADRLLCEALDRFAASEAGSLPVALVHEELAAIAAAGGRGAEASEHIVYLRQGCADQCPADEVRATGRAPRWAEAAPGRCGSGR